MNFLKRKSYSLFLILLVFTIIPINLFSQSKLFFYGKQNNDLLTIIKNNKIPVTVINDLEIKDLPNNCGLIVTAADYPAKKVTIGSDFYNIIERKKIRLYIEYPNVFPNNLSAEETYIGELERGVVSSNFFGNKLPFMTILGVNDCHIIPVNITNPIIAFAKVAGFDKAEYGLTDTKVYPLLFQVKNKMIATSRLSNFIDGRMAPTESWKIVWESILKWLIKKDNLSLNSWKPDPSPTYGENEELPVDARKIAIIRGVDWFYKSRLLLHPSWKDEWLYYQKDGNYPFGPPISDKKILGDGSMGILEGHASKINYDGTQQYRYWIRTDVQGETAFALAVAGDLLRNKEYNKLSEKLMDFMFYNARAREKTNDKTKGSYGLLGWTITHPTYIYNDDARALLGAIGASAYLKNERWNRLIIEGILANFRTSSKQGFQGNTIYTNRIDKDGWEYYFNRDFINPHPHYESWMWACFLWLYDKTGYKPLLERTKTAIKITMDSYPDKWKWSNGIQQERARMILPLAWLVRVENTPEHVKWLTTIADELLKNQQLNGGIREELGNDKLGKYGHSKTNADYGKQEAPVIFRNGDKVADMLYTNNFAFFALNEAAKATNEKKYYDAVNKLSDFLIRIQITSNLHPDLDGGWFRTFDYGRWEYWGSNADAGWGPWCTLAGWTQSWIVGTQTFLEKNQSFWESTKSFNLKKEFEESLWMLEQSKP